MSEKRPLPAKYRERYNSISDKVEAARGKTLNPGTALAGILDLVKVNNEMQDFIQELLRESYKW